MKKVLYGALFISFSVIGEDISSNISEGTLEDFVPLDEPEQRVTGAYYGLGYDLSFIKHKVSAESDNPKESKKVNKSATQSAISLLAGFGTGFYRDYYIGLEFEIMHRFSKKTSYDGEIGLKFPSQFGINMDVRFGYLFPKQGSMVYLTAGFSRTLGKVVVKTQDGHEVERGFGSYYPTIGLGVEYKLNPRWNVRLDGRYSITSKDSGNHLQGNKGWDYNVKPQRIGIRLALTRNI